MNIKKCTILAICASLTLSTNVSLAHGHHGGGHHNYNYDYNYDDYDYGCNHYSGHHAHIDGVCPYNTDDESYHCYRVSTVKKVQKRLNRLGYECGSADGVYGTKTKNCIKKFQKKKNMSVNGKITQKLLQKLKISN